MLLSGFLIKNKLKEYFQNSDKEKKELLGLNMFFVLLGTFILVSAFTIWICAIIKAFYLCKRQKTLHILLITYVPFYASVFLLIGKKICSKNSRNTSHNKNILN
jgi:hypothetical protein